MFSSKKLFLTNPTPLYCVDAIKNKPGLPGLLEFYTALPAPGSPAVVANDSTYWFYYESGKVKVDIDSPLQLNISAGLLFHGRIPYVWPYGSQAYWNDVVNPYILEVESVSSASSTGGRYYYTIMAKCADVPNVNSITRPEISLTNFRLDGLTHKIDFSVSATVSDSKYEANPTMTFYIEYQVPGCDGETYGGWRSVFNSLPPSASPSNGKPKTFTQSYTMNFSDSANCRVTTLDGLLSVPYGGKIRVKATHAALILFSDEKQLPSAP